MITRKSTHSSNGQERVGRVSEDSMVEEAATMARWKALLERETSADEQCECEETDGADRPREADRLEEVPKHDRVDDSADSGAAREDTERSTSPSAEPVRDATDGGKECESRAEATCNACDESP